jgi:putative transposase
LFFCEEGKCNNKLLRSLGGVFGVRQLVVGVNKMDGVFKTYSNNPPHFFRDDTYYMITASVYEKKDYLKRDGAKSLLFESIEEFTEKFEWRLLEWAILDNHYHLVLQSKRGDDLPNLMGRIHRKSANSIKKMCFIQCKRFWWNYWDTCPKDETQLFAMQNYVLYNPVKHGIVQDLQDYRWSSFEKYGEDFELEELKIRFRKYGMSSDRRIIDEF